jgi:iron complex transport system substrate-binding protein
MRLRTYGLRLLALVLALSLLAGCGTSAAAQTAAETISYTDDSGRTLEIPKEIQAVVPSGSLAQMVLLSLCPEKLVGLSSNLSRMQKRYIAQEYTDLPVLGSYYGGASTMNFEEVIGSKPDLIIDVGETKTTIQEDMNSIQESTQVPAIFIGGSLTQLADAYRKLGTLLDCEEKGNQIADYIDGVLADIQEKAATIPESEKITVMYGDGAYGLDAKSADSIHGEIIELVGAVNVAETYTDGGVSMEQVLLWDPDVVILSPDANYDEIFEDEVWAAVRAVQTGQVYEVPYGPYNWIDKPPSVQRVLGIQWLAQLLYPEVYQYDMTAVAQEFYKLFYDYDLTAEEAQALMANSIYVETTNADEN